MQSLLNPFTLAIICRVSPQLGIFRAIGSLNESGGDYGHGSLSGRAYICWLSRRCLLALVRRVFPLWGRVFQWASLNLLGMCVNGFWLGRYLSVTARV